jgi:ParB family transcriptional regulator, chromosome partitioning protein
MNMVEDISNGRSRLGRGLAALIGDAPSLSNSSLPPKNVQKASIEFLRPNPQNPRTYFSENELEELTASIRERGILQPIIVRQVPNVVDAFEIIAGERRWRAAQRAGLNDVPVLLVEADDRQSLEFAIIENVQRSDLNALEEALGYERLINSFSYTQADLGRVVGKSRSHVANALRLLNLPQSIKDKLHNGQLSAGHARALLTLPNAEMVAEDIVAKGLSVRDVEKLSHPEVRQNFVDETAKPVKDSDTKALEKALMDVTGLVFSINHKKTGGAVTIKYKTLDELDSLCRRLQY